MFQFLPVRSSYVNGVFQELPNTYKASVTYLFTANIGRSSSVPYDASLNVSLQLRVRRRQYPIAELNVPVNDVVRGSYEALTLKHTVRSGSKEDGKHIFVAIEFYGFGISPAIDSVSLCFFQDPV